MRVGRNGASEVDHDACLIDSGNTTALVTIQALTRICSYTIDASLRVTEVRHG